VRAKGRRDELHHADRDGGSGDTAEPARAIDVVADGVAALSRLGHVTTVPAPPVMWFVEYFRR
jgi:hypothetical protein